MNPWHGLIVIVSVCLLVMVSLVLAKNAHKNSMTKLAVAGRMGVTPAGLDKINRIPSNGNLRF